MLAEVGEEIEKVFRSLLRSQRNTDSANLKSGLVWRYTECSSSVLAVGNLRHLTIRFDYYSEGCDLLDFLFSHCLTIKASICNGP